ncbi:MAG: DNA-binding protein [Gammaproteobacteria bacterium]|nr:DNA-binding protein [Gammaproteobacteria bacterium]
MPPKGVTQELVEKAISALEARGKTPSVRAVRKELRTGSSTTISRHMASLRTAQASIASDEKTNIPEELAEHIQSLVAEIWDVSIKTAASRTLDLRSSIHQQAYQLSSKLEQAQECMKQMNENIKRLHDLGDGALMESINDKENTEADEPGPTE